MLQALTRPSPDWQFDHHLHIDEFDFDLLVIPGGFAFGDRYYENATDNYILNPGIMAKESPVSKI